MFRKKLIGVIVMSAGKTVDPMPIQNKRKSRVESVHRPYYQVPSLRAGYTRDP